MDRWERRLQLMARTGLTGDGTSQRVGPVRRPAVIDARDSLLVPAGSTPADLVHPDEMQVVHTLLELAAQRPEFHAELSLLARDHDRWEYHRFEIVNEVMGPVLRLVGGPPVEPLDSTTGDELQSCDPPASGRDLAPVVVDRSDLLDHLAIVLDRSTDTAVAVLLLDLDRFKLHNDVLGAEGGDALLAIVAERLAEVADGLYGGSLGGDEFVVVVDGLDDPSDAKALAERLRRAVAEPMEIAGETRSITVTVGLSIGGKGTEPDHLLRDADTALFVGKDRGRDRVQVFGRQLGARIARQLSIAQQLKRALAEGTLELHYQPVVSLESGVIVAAEALMRINGHADSQALSPSSLIEAAEDNGLIARLGRYVLEETTSQIARWEARFSDLRLFRVSVNIAPAQLSNRDFSSAIAHALAATGVSPKRLSLELTESVLLAANPTVDLIVQELVDLGIAFGLDDFGADGSSLGGLRRFPIDFVKIDRELVELIDRDETVEAIIASTVSLARQLGVTTIAVGVERQSQCDLLRRLGCDTAQGYLFAPALSSGDFTERL